MTNRKFCVWFHEVDKHDGALVGGKGANLGEMTLARLPVPPGFIITSHAYYYLLEKTDIREKIEKILNGLDYNDSQQLQKKSREIQKIIKTAPVPKEIIDSIVRYYFSMAEHETAHTPKKLTLLEKFLTKATAHQLPVAVRSSATAEDLPEASFAGQQATFLNIRGEANLLHAVRNAWASLFTARAMFYRHDQGFDHFKVGIALPVQKMVSSDVSGVMFTIDPVTNEKSRVVIEAIFGLGELIVQGAVTPDHYEVDKRSGKIVVKTVSRQFVYMPGVGQKEVPFPKDKQNKRKMTDEQILDLARLGRRLEHHYYFPQDIEWAMENNVLYIVQTRPITTMGTDQKKQNGDIAKQLKKLTLLLSGDPASPGVASGAVEIVTSASQIHKVKQGEILVAEQTNPDFVPAMKKAAAIVTAKGGRTSHAAIVSRELGLPAIVGAEKALDMLKDGMEITVDGAEGKIFKGKIITSISSKISNSSIPSTIKTATKVYVNLAEASRAEEVAKMNVDGVGLLRAEFMLADIGVHPKWIIQERKQKQYANDLAEKIAVFCRAFGDRPVVYRTTDFKTNEYKNLKHGAQFEDNEENPMLGYRGAARYVGDPEVFELELSAIKHVRHKLGHRNLHVMIPFVRTPKQLLDAKRIMASTGLLRSPSFKLWMMAELPVNVILLDEFIKTGIDGISIGSNDLTQLILGVDRDNSRVAPYFDERNPAVMWALEKIIRTCHTHRITVSICGQAPSDYPELVENLVEWGVTSVSVNPDAVDGVRQTIYKAEQKKGSLKH